MNTAALRIVIDTNVLLACFPKKSPFRWLFDALLAEQFRLCVSSSILWEYQEIIARKTTPELASNICSLLLTLAPTVTVEPSYRWNLIFSDPDDNKFVDCYVAAGADILITKDNHFSLLNTLDFPPVTVMTPEQFRQHLL